MKYHTKNYTSTEYGCIHCDYEFNYGDLVKQVAQEYVIQLNAKSSPEEQLALTDFIDYKEEIIQIICERYEDIQQQCYDCDNGPDDMDYYKACKEY